MAGGIPRPRKTVEELDAEMNDYFGGAEQEGDGDAAAGPQSAVAASAMNEDEDMIL